MPQVKTHPSLYGFTGTVFILTSLLSPHLATAASLTTKIQDSVTLTGKLFSEPVHLGLSETNGHPGASLTADLEIKENFFVGASGYYSENAPSPQRPKGYVLYGGINWGDNTRYDLTLIHRAYPGDFRIDWDFTELQFNAHFTPQFTIGLTGTTDYYGINGVNSLAITANYTHDFSQKIFGKIEGGAVHLNGTDPDGDDQDSYQYVAIGGGYRFNRVSVQAMYRINNAQPSIAFSAGQTDNALVLTLNWLIY